MIIKSYELNKINLKKKKFILFYGKNEGLKNESTNNLLKNNKTISRYEEKEILENTNIFLENIFSKSLFENEKIIIIKRVTDKILRVINEIKEKNIKDVRIILNADILEKKSKIRSFFERSK
jgi:DNA polymerase-3 subunit delta